MMMAGQIIQAFRAVDDDNDADHELKAEVAERITELSRKLYLYTDLDMWELLFRFIDRKIAAL